MTTGAVRAAVRSVTDYKTQKQVKEATLKKLQLSGLTVDDCKKLSLQTYTGAELLLEHRNLPAHAAGFKIPYFDFTGKQTKFWRYRYMEETRSSLEKLTASKPMRYTQAPGTVNELYLPPLYKKTWKVVAEDANIPLIVTEGELKAACATKYGPYPCIGLGGVWNFKASSQHMALLPQFAVIEWSGRRVYIAYDSDAARNSEVLRAQNALARELTKLGALTWILKLPDIATNAKTGLDDYIVANQCAPLNEELFTDAAEWRAAQELHKLNEEVVYVENPGLIMRLDTLQKLAPRAFTDHAYADRIYYEEQVGDKGRVKMVEKSAPREWLRWPSRFKVSKLVYKPGAPICTDSNELNVWPGWGCTWKEGSIKPWQQLLDYLFQGEPESRAWFEQWCAYPLQFPGTKLYSTAVLWGLDHGTGKSLIGYTLFKIYGQNSTEIKDEHLQASHNEWAENKQFVMGDEVTSGDKRGMADRLKTLITQQQLRINVKYIPSYTVNDCINYYLTSNHPDSFFLEDKDRRYFIHEVKAPPLDKEFYREYDRWYKGKTGPSALFNYLLSVDTRDFDPAAPALVSSSKRDMIEQGRSDLASWTAMLREQPDAVLRLNGQVLKFDLWRAEDLLRLYDPESRSRVTANGMSRELKIARVLKVNGGVGCATASGQFKLWAVRNQAKYAQMRGIDLGKAYEAERSTPVPKF